MQAYNKSDIDVVRCTLYPGDVCKLACDHTMVAEPEPGTEASASLLRFLVKAEHTSVLEHCSVTLAISGVSRSLMAQLTRSRIASVTCQSQHYQDYTDVPAIVSQSVVDNPVLEEAILSAYKAYGQLQLQGVPKEEARQVLPNAAAVNILWTVNARELMLFLRQRMCKRNVEEMTWFAVELKRVCMQWWPTLFTLAGPPCYMDGQCNQGKMRSPLCE